MAKSMRSKKKRRLRTLRRDIAEPFYEKKEEAKLAAQEAALAAPKLEIPTKKSDMEIEPVYGGSESAPMAVDVSENKSKMLKPVGGIQKHGKSKSKLKKEKRRKKKKKKKLNF